MTWDPSKYTERERDIATLALLEAQRRLFQLDSGVFGPSHAHAMRYAYGLADDAITDIVEATDPVFVKNPPSPLTTEELIDWTES